MLQRLLPCVSVPLWLALGAAPPRPASVVAAQPSDELVYGKAWRMTDGPGPARYPDYRPR